MFVCFPSYSIYFPSYGGRDVVACYNICSHGSIVCCELLCAVWIYAFSGLFCLINHSPVSLRLSVLWSVVLICCLFSIFVSIHLLSVTRCWRHHCMWIAIVCCSLSDSFCSVLFFLHSSSLCLLLYFSFLILCFFLYPRCSPLYSSVLI